MASTKRTLRQLQTRCPKQILNFLTKGQKRCCLLMMLIIRNEMLDDQFPDGMFRFEKRINR